MTAAEQFIEDFLLLLTSRSRWSAGLHLLREVLAKYRSGQGTRDLPADGFRPELVDNNQRGQIYRHLQLHVGLRLLGGPFVLLSVAADLIDHHQAGKNRCESKTELLDNHAARLCAKAVMAYHREQLPYGKLREKLRSILLEDAK